jgi:hypothetical protein
MRWKGARRILLADLFISRSATSIFFKTFDDRAGALRRLHDLVAGSMS